VSTTPSAAESGTRSRTRRAILDATVTVLGRNRTATLGEIAQAAEVGRSTLHRYFPDRDVLVQAAVEDALAYIGTQFGGAAIDQGAPADAMRRLVTALVDAGPQILFVFGDPAIMDTLPDDEDDPTNVAMLDLIRRGQAEGVFDSEVDAAWIQDVIWALVYSGAEAAARGRLPRHGVVANVIRTLEQGIAGTA
jgi:AcrR family transcriptional regulator